MAWLWLQVQHEQWISNFYSSTKISLLSKCFHNLLFLLLSFCGFDLLSGSFSTTLWRGHGFGHFWSGRRFWLCHWFNLHLGLWVTILLRFIFFFNFDFGSTVYYKRFVFRESTNDVINQVMTSSYLSQQRRLYQPVWTFLLAGMWLRYCPNHSF